MNNKIAIKTAAIFSFITIIASSLHFWPFPQSKLWQFACPTNTIPIFFSVFFASVSLKNKDFQLFSSKFPPSCIIAFIVVNIISIIFCQSPIRGLTYCLKLLLTLIPTYIMFKTAIAQKKNIIYILIASAIAIVIACLSDTWQSQLKKTTYLLILAPLALAPISYLLKIKSLKINTAIVVLAATIIISNSINFNIYEKDKQNIRQTYLEWQAITNLIGSTNVTGPGCINDLRGKYYLRLPKLNTIEPFDQNGYLAIAAETSLIGLACFLLILKKHFAKIFKTSKSNQLKIFLFASLSGACIAHLSSSVLYNGVIIAFVLILSLSEICLENSKA